MGAVQIVLIVLIGLSLLMSTLSVILVFAWRHTTPEIADIRTNLNALAMDQADIIDKFTHYMQREDAREARAAKKRKKHDDEAEYEMLPNGRVVPLTLAEQKNELRRSLINRKAG